MGGRNCLFFLDLFLLCRAGAELRCRPQSAAISLLPVQYITVHEAFPKRGPPCWRPLFSGFRLLFLTLRRSLTRILV